MIYFVMQLFCCALFCSQWNIQFIYTNIVLKFIKIDPLVPHTYEGLAEQKTVKDFTVFTRLLFLII